MTLPARPGRHAAPAVPLIQTRPSTIDLHTHTTRSDGLLEPTELIAAAAAAGVRLLAITDHDNLAAYRELTAAGAIPPGVELVSGVEINALARGIPNVDELHVLGFGVDPDDAGFEAALSRQRVARRLRFERTVGRLRELGMPIDMYVEQVDMAQDDALGRPTIARALVAAGFAESVEDAFQRLIGHGCPAYMPRDGLGPIDAIRAIRAAGGLPSLAHFWDAPSQVPLLRELQAAGLAGLEVHHGSFGPEAAVAVGAVAASLGLVPTGGTDFHGDTQTYAEAHAALALPDEIGAGFRSALATLSAGQVAPAGG
ncbi:MAG TPA: PHP domain-containing protein [Candidatus Limnocylindrales bacterium]|nr:PHP domain-containing protein [Candidatus Limnocylindrales bacterium]